MSLMGLVALLAGVAFGLALILLVAFFATKDERYDQASGWSFGAFALLAIPTIMIVAGRLPDGGVVVPAAAVVGIASVAVLGLGEVAATIKLVDFRRIGPLVALGFFGFLGWIGLTSVLFISGSAFPASLGWLGLGTIVVGFAIVGWVIVQPGVLRGERDPGRGQLAAVFVPLVGIVAWMVWLGLSL